MSPRWLRLNRLCLQCRRPGFHPWVGKIPWRWGWQPTPVFLPGESHGQRSLAGYSPRGCIESDTTERLSLSATSLWAVLSQPRGPRDQGAVVHVPKAQGLGDASLTGQSSALLSSVGEKLLTNEQKDGISHIYREAEGRNQGGREGGTPL